MVKDRKKRMLSLVYQYHRKRPKNVKIMTLCYAFLGVNAIVLTVFSENRKNLDIGIVFFMLSIVSYMETEKKRYDDDAVFGSCFIHCIVTIVGAWYYSAWWLMVLYVIEVLIFIYAASSGT